MNNQLNRRPRRRAETVFQSRDLKKSLFVFALAVAIGVAAALSARAQSVAEIETRLKTFKNSKRYSVDYDRFSDKLFVRYRTATLKEQNSFARIKFGVSLVSFGKEMKDPAIWFVFFSDAVEWAFLRDNDLTIIADGERMVFGKGKHDGEVSSSRRFVRVSETVQHRIEPEQLKLIANAKSVEMRLGRFETKLDVETLEMLRNMTAFFAQKKEQKE